MLYQQALEKMTIESFSIEYDANNKDNVFSRGDTITGRVVLELSKETKIERLSIKAKGKASVLWTEHYGPAHNIVYTSKEKYFSIEKHVLDDSTCGSKVIAVGRHLFPFTFEIPNMQLPPSFKGQHGKIVYSLEARASRSMRLDQKTKEEFFIVSTEDLCVPDITIVSITRNGTRFHKILEHKASIRLYSQEEQEIFFHHVHKWVKCNGDFITGQVTLELTKDTDVTGLSVKLKGKAKVLWTETHGKTTVTYQSKEKYFSIQQFLIQEGHGNSRVSQGSTVYPFTFQIPAQDLPSSFKGTWGKILYTLEANLSRSMRVNSKAKAEFNLVSKSNMGIDSTLMAPQHGVTDKKMKLFNSGYVAMDVNINKTGFHQGEGIKVVTSVHNKSSREVRPKYCVYRKYSFFAKGKRKLETKDVLKEVGDAVPPSAGQTVTKVITIPTTVYPSIFNCTILKAEYRLRVYLDVKYASDPQIKFPIVILPSAQGFDTKVYPTYGFESFPTAPPYAGAQPSAPPPYETCGIYPILPDYGAKY